MIKPEYKNIPDTEFVPLTENVVGKKYAGLYEMNKKGEVRRIGGKKILKATKTHKGYLRLKSETFCKISRCCNGKQKTAYGYKWEYADKQPDKDNNNKNN